MNVFTKANHIIQVKNENLDKASSSYALKQGKVDLAKEIIRVKRVRDDEKLKKHMEVINNFGVSPEMWIMDISMIYLLLEIITMLTNRKRRTINDFIAGTEVRRL